MEIFFSEKPYFFRAKNATVSTLRSGTDYCWLYCGWKAVKIRMPLFKSIISFLIFVCTAQKSASINVKMKLGSIYVLRKDIEVVGGSEKGNFSLLYLMKISWVDGSKKPQNSLT